MKRMEITQDLITGFISAFCAIIWCVVTATLYVKWFKVDADNLRKDTDAMRRDFVKHCEEANEYREKVSSMSTMVEVVKTDLVWIKTMLLKIDEKMHS